VGHAIAVDTAKQAYTHRIPQFNLLHNGGCGHVLREVMAVVLALTLSHGIE
jgi:hypothetical protein